MGRIGSKCDTCWVLSAGTGERIAVYRRRRGLSQTVLAGLIGRSESWLSQVERGIRAVDRLSVLLDIVRILHIDVESLVGRPWQLAPNADPGRHPVRWSPDDIEVQQRRVFPSG